MSDTARPRVVVHTDGACSGNPGPGGWGVILDYNGVRKELSGGEARTTNNRMELKAAIVALESTYISTVHGRFNDSRATIAAMSSMRLFVVRASPPESSLRTPL